MSGLVAHYGNFYQDTMSSSYRITGFQAVENITPRNTILVVLSRNQTFKLRKKLNQLSRFLQQHNVLLQLCFR